MTASVFPGVGGGVEVGQVFARKRSATWSFEVDGTLQDLEYFGHEPSSNVTGDDDRYAQLRAGIKVASNPNGRHHLVGRGGFTAFKANAVNDYIERATTFYGFFVGAGFEFDINDHWTTGPEASLLIGYPEGSGNNDEQVIPQVGWHFIRWL